MLMAKESPRITRGGRVADALVGMAGGVMGGLGGFTGVLPTCGAPARAGQDVQRAIIQNFNLAMLLVTFVTYHHRPRSPRRALPLLAIVVPAMLVPVLLGARLYRYRDARFRQIVLGLLTLSGGDAGGQPAQVLGSWG